MYSTALVNVVSSQTFKWLEFETFAEAAQIGVGTDVPGHLSADPY